MGDPRSPVPAAFRARTPTAFRVALLATTVLAFVLRLRALDAESLHMDELLQAETYVLSPSMIVTKAADMGQPPLDYFIGAVLYRLGLAGSDWWVRLPAAVFGAGCVVLLGWWVAAIGGSLAGIATAVLLAVCPLHVVMSQEARPYTIFFFFALATTLAYVHARRRHRLVSWCVFGVLFWCMLMTRWTDPHFIFLGLCVHALFAYRQGERRSAARVTETYKLWAFVTTVSVAYAIYNPIFGMLFDRCGRSVAHQPGAWVERMLSQLGQSFSGCFSGYSANTAFVALPAERWVLTAGAALALLGLGVLLRLAWRTREARTVVFTATILPFAFVYAFVYAHLSNAVAKPQYLLLGAAAVTACMGLAAEAIRRSLTPLNRLVAGCSFVAAVGVAAVPMLQASLNNLNTLDKRDWRGVMTYLRAHSEPQDAFVVVATDTVPPTFHVAVYGRARYGRSDMKFLNVSLTMMVEELDRSPWTDSNNRVWLVGYNDRMYLGYDQLPTPSPSGPHMRVHPFNGLFILEIGGEGPAAARLMDCLAALYEQLPDGCALVAPAVLSGKFYAAKGDVSLAKASFAEAVRQCRSDEEAASLVRNHLSAWSSLVVEDDPMLAARPRTVTPSWP